jgi:chemotaxis protein MotB
MPKTTRLILLSVAGLLACSSAACRVAPLRDLRQSQYRALQLFQQNQALASESQGAILQAQQSAAEKGQLEQQLASAQAANQTLQQRLDNLQAERSEMQERYVSLLNKSKSDASPLSERATRELEKLKEKYKDFDFDPQTGVSKFHSDILFESGSAEIRPDAQPLLQEFARIMSAGDSQRLNILVVGHTDDKPVKRANTRAKHMDNWDLSVHRATHVMRSLARHGVKEARMGAAGYGQYQPLEPNRDDRSRQRNRRVEIFVLAPNASVAGWDSQNSRQ